MNSLLELQIALVLLFITTTSVVANAPDSSRKLTLKLYTQKLYNLFEEALTFAAETGQEATVAKKENSFNLIVQERVIRNILLPSQLSLEFETSEKELFRAYSAISVSPASILINAKETSFTCLITISLRGRIRQKCR
jgi:hypothetical protein